MSADITIEVLSPGLARSGFDVVVTLPTFRRPALLAETLDSLVAQRTARRMAVIVMDNDAERREGVAAARPYFEDGRLAGLVIIAHERGNCSAYNAGWTTALDRFDAFGYLAVIDDDERAVPEWIEALCRTSDTLDADIVGGPQVPVFSDPARAGLADHPVFSPPYRRTGPVPALYSSGNLLIRRSVLADAGRPFLDTAFNFIGGGDSDFLSRSARKGAHLAWCQEAPVMEIVPERRTKPDWIRARALRNGQISTLVERKRRAGEPLGRGRVLAHSLALLAASPLRSAARLLEGGSVALATYPMLIAAGRMMAEFGQVHEQYRQPEKN
ncbi:MAG: glycosyltransferase [Rhizobiaceae bacterium]